MNKIIRITQALFFACIVLTFTACEQAITNPVDADITEFAEDPEGASLDFSNHEGIGDGVTIEEHIHSPINLEFDLSEIEEINFEFPDGTTELRYKYDDLVFTREQINELYALSKDPNTRQYHTNNLVNNNQTIDVLGYSGGPYALSQKLRTALSWSVDNYNALNMGLNLNLSWGTNFGPADIVVYSSTDQSEPPGGTAGYPSGGNPYKWLALFSLESYDTNVVEHVITHEMGHCLGMRHTDYFSRASCNSPSLQFNEGITSIGANHASGTPTTNFDTESIMLACGGLGSDGEFSFFDRVALEYMYPQ